ncbi:MAG TPA: RNA polymerase sigma factor [Gemmatimonas sp.]|nr:RNA polymerase sigma factor [Gemmatimonas sp.]
MTDIDPEIPRRARAGDRRAFAALVEYLYPRGLRFAMQMLGNVQDAEEALQDSFVRVHAHLAGFRDDARFEPWFFRILANRCRTLGAKRQRHHALIEYGELPIDAAAESDPRSEWTAEWTAEVHRALDTLPAEQREAFLLRHVEGMEYEDMAIVTGAGLSTLRMRVKRACDGLRLRLKEVELYG